MNENRTERNLGGRPRAEVSQEAFGDALRRFRAHELTMEEAAAACGIGRSAFYRRVKEAEEPKKSLGEILRSDPVSESDTEQIRLIPIDLIDPDPDNFYSMDGIEALSWNIELIGLQQPLRVRPDGDRYVIVSGHRRREAIRQIIEAGTDQFKAGVPCIVEAGADSAAMRELKLIYANSATRVMRSSEISRQAERVTALLYQLKEEGVEFPGRMREHVAEACRISSTKLARLHAIRANLDENLLKLYDGNKLSEAAAYELQKLPADVQAYLGEQKKIQNNGIEMARAEEMVRNAEKLLHPRCTCPDGSECTQTHARFKQTATASLVYYTCTGGCCLNCTRDLNSCPYMCPQAKAKQHAGKEAEKAERERQAQQQAEADDRQRKRLAKEYAKILELAEAAGLDDKTHLYFSDAYSVDDLRKRAAGKGFSSWKLSPRNTPVSGMYASDLAKSADVLGVTVDFLLGRPAPAPVSESDTEPEWKTGEPPRPGRYFCKVDMDTTKPIENRCEWDGKEWSVYGVKLQDKWQIVGWWPLPKEG